jgi:phosphatidylglycerol lysyltransferase
MTKIIAAFDNLEEAQAAAKRLAVTGVDQNQISIICNDSKSSRAQSELKKSLAWGGALGAGLALLIPHGGVFYLAGRLARSAALHLLSVTVKGMLAGAATGGAFDLLRGAVPDRRAARETTEIIAAGRFALALDGNWVAAQRARAAIGAERAQADEHLVEMVNRYGYEYQSFVLLYGGMEVWRSQDPEAAVLYRRVGRVAVVGAAPLTAREHMCEVIRRFLAHCRERNLDCLMLPLGKETADIARECGMGLLKIGESGYFNLPEWKPAGDRGKKVRAGVNQARKAGIAVERYDPLANRDERARAEIEDLCQEWIDTREVDALGWLLELDPFKLAEYKRYFLARAANGHLEGMLACCPIPTRNGWYLEDLIRRPGASRGVSELLIVETLRSLAAEGAELATLATSPLAGVESNGSSGEFKHLARLLRLIYEHLDTFYHFKALHRFKAKFAPSFVEHEYVAIYPPRIRLRMVLGVIGAFDPGGLTNVMASKLRRLWRETRQTKSPVESPE